jgi:hypothetical protein
MGLDWNPGNKPKPGHEAEFERLFHELQKPSVWWRRRKERRFSEITVSAFETLAAPRVGIDTAATAWALERYREKTRDATEQEWIAKLHGTFVVDLLRPSDGIPRYSNGATGGYVEPFSFRAQFLTDCEYIIGSGRLEEAYVSKLPENFLQYGEQLQKTFDVFAAARGLSEDDLSSDDPDSPVFHADVVLSAAKWCRFWAGKGHCLEAYW